MFGKIGILLWKENNYRAIYWTLLGILIPLAMIILVNVNLAIHCDRLQEMRHNPLDIPGEVHKPKICTPKEVYLLYAYEPPNAFLEILLNETGCLDKSNSNYGIRTGLENEFTFGIKFSGINDSHETVPEFLDYVMYPREGKSDYPSQLWQYSGSINDHHYTSEKSFGRQPSAIKFQKHLNLIFRNKTFTTSSVKVTADIQNKHFPRPLCKIAAVLILFLPILMFMWENSVYLKILVEEKKFGLKLYLQVMGFSQYQLKLAGLIWPMMMHMLMITLATIFFYVPLIEDHYVLVFVHPAWMICHMILSAINLTNFQWFLSTLFQNEMYATGMSLLLMWVPPITLIGTLDSYSSMSNHINRLSCMIPSLCLTKGFILLLDFETYGKSAKFLEKLAPEIQSSLTIADILFMNVVDTFFYFLLGLYLENIIPGNGGVTLPYNFFLKKSYWKSRKDSVKELGNEETAEQNKETIEAVPSNLKVAISVKNVSKKFRNGVVALDNVNIDFFEGEIIGLLGHNGAGKSTLFSILCGMFNASYGEVSVYGQDIKDPNHRKNFGYCPQYDILLNATVLQNIVFFGMAKGLSRKEARKDAKTVISRLGLEQSAHVRAPKLSGGQKRKLSLAVGLSGNPQVLLLDEPTTGIDTTMRRQIWNIILELRGNKTVILCTHLLEEADALCNRIAVLSHGKLHCYGSPMFLKSKYGTGFSLSIVAPDTSKANSITGLVKRFIKTAEFKYQNMLTLVFKLSEKEISNFPALFEELDLKKNQNEVVNYSLTVSTMEDVFLNINSTLKEEYEAQRNRSEAVLMEDSNDEYEKKKRRGVSLFCLRIQGLLIKKWIYVRRNFIFYLFTLVLFLIVNVVFSYFMGSKGEEKTVIPYSLSIYGEPEILYATNSSDTNVTNLIDCFKMVIEDSKATFRKVDNITEELNKLYKEDFTKFLKSILVIQFFEEEINIMYNKDAQYALPIAIDLVANAFLLANDSYVKASLMFESFKEFSELDLCSSILNFIFLLLFERYIFLMSPLEERKTEVKTLQLLLVSPASYWISHLIFDLPILTVYATICCTIMGMVNEGFAEIILTDTSIFSINLLFYCIGLLFSMYIWSTLFSSYTSCVIADLLFLLISGMTFVIPADVYAYTRYLSPTALWFLQFLNICLPGSYPVDSYRLEYYCLGAFLVLILIDIGIFRQIFHKLFTCILYCLGIVRFKYEHPKDDTVENEKEAVRTIIKNKQLSTKMLVINNVKRWYCFCNCKKCVCCKYGCVKSAVKGVSFAVEKGECFGLVGTNGAGKTTVFGVLSGALIPSFGTAYMESANLLNPFLKYKTFSRMGYCPQFSSVLPTFKGREMLQLFGRLRGCSGSLLKKEVKKWIERTNLQEYENRKCGNYSGGNKRKLSIGISLIGNPSLVLLDEPTTGIDASGRRLIWDLISDFREAGGSAVLTSHSMDECEALCSRLTIMTKGQMRVIGETTTLKNIYGQGYTVLLKLSFSATDEQRADLQKAMENTFGEGCHLTDSHLTVLQYEITKETASWKKLFADLNTMKTKFAFLESFFASSTTLEQIFMNLSKD